MKVLHTDAHVWWLALADEIRVDKAVPPDAAREAAQKTFSFQNVPTSPAAPGQPIELLNGVLQTESGPIVINRVVVYADGVNVQVPGTTEDADKVLETLLEIGLSSGIMREPITPPNHTYISYMVVDLDVSIDRFFPQALRTTIAGTLGLPEVNAQNLHFSWDPILISNQQGAYRAVNKGFKIERRDAVPYAMNRYFSAANLTTKEHLAVVAAVENAAKQAT